MELFNEDLEQQEFPVLEEVEFEDDEIFEEDLDNVLGGIPYDYAKERLEASELGRMFEDTEKVVETESKQK